jgi:hypothetical protein
MKKLILFFSLLLCVSGCAQEKKGIAPSVMNEKKGLALQEKQIVNEVPTEPEMKDGKLEVPISVSRESLEDIITTRSWGFSVYDPRQETVDYYTATGRFLGRIER